MKDGIVKDILVIGVGVLAALVLFELGKRFLLKSAFEADLEEALEAK